MSAFCNPDRSADSASGAVVFATKGDSMQLRSFLISATALCMLCACSPGTKQSMNNNVEFDLASEAVIYQDNWVRLSPLQVYVYPTGDPAKTPRTLFVPFRVTQRMENATIVGQNISRVIWQSWLQGEVFDTLEFSSTNTPYRSDVALALGRQRGADLVIGGYVTHFLDGGTVSESAVSITVEAWDVHSGNMLWSLGQGGLMPASTVSDYLLFATKSRMPRDPAGVIISAIGRDMGRKIRSWAKGDIVPVPEPSANSSDEKKAF